MHAPISNGTDFGPTSSTPANGLQHRQENGAYVDFWAKGGSASDAKTLSNVKIAGLDGPVVLETVWANEGGSIRIDDGNASEVVSHATSIGKTSTALTIEIGGATGGSAPHAHYLVRSACVRLDTK